ncbi:hypothetical protein HU724_004180 [Pseudomonas iranensis]|uniref:DUF6124 family protein n=1 Tax=Pseudomonas iranensis TaxID=2745503 RepID=UPI001645BFAC|nr:DUF6124 family protein [Pseudomonas iranensis]QXI23484.1 hypothetical protein HU724_004180 [Pseudomonas iranensis]
MKKITPDPPLADPTFADPLLEAQKLKEAADRAIDYYLNPRLIKDPGAPRKPSTLFIVDPAADNETLLVHACESLASASIMASDLAGFIDGPQRSSLLGIQQVIMLGELAVNRVLDRLVPE